MPQKRTCSLTVMLEPALYKILKETHAKVGLSVWCHDMIVAALTEEGALTSDLYLNALEATSPALPTITHYQDGAVTVEG